MFHIVKPEWDWYVSIPGELQPHRGAGDARELGTARLWPMAARHGRRVAAACVAYWAWAVLGAVLAAEQGPAWEFVAAATKIVLPFLVGITTIDSTAKLRQLAWVIVLSQGRVAAALNLDYLSGFNRLVEADFAGMDNNTTAAASVDVRGPGIFPRTERQLQWKHKALAFACAC